MKVSSNKLKALLRREKRSRTWYKALLVIACVVVCCTVYNMVLPALTMNGDYVCGYEAHTHGSACYTPDETGEAVLTCTLPEHQHDEHCLVQQKEPDPHTCGYLYEHVHEDGCYADGVLVCTLVEHTHTAACLPAEEPVYFMAVAVPGEDTVPAPEELSLAVSAEEAMTAQAPEEAEPAASVEPTEEALPEDEAAEPETEPEEAAAEPAEPEDEALSEEMLEVMMADITPTLPFEPTSSYRQLDSNEGATVNYYFSKYVKPAPEATPVEEQIDPATAYGDGYMFTLGASNPDTGVLMVNRYVYYYKIDMPGIRLFMQDENSTTQPKAVIPLEEYANEWVDVREAAEMIVRRDESTGAYWFFFHAKVGTVSRLSLKCSMRTGLEPSAPYMNKAVAWDSANAFRYTITALVPHLYNTYNSKTNAHDPLYSHYYYFTDTATMDSPTGVFNAFVQNQDSLAVTATSQAFGTKPVPSLENAGIDDTIAYYLSSEGRLYLFNRTPHDLDDGHPVADPDDITVAHDGWCLCWGQTSDIEITITYLDTYGQTHATGGKIKNEARLRQNGYDYAFGEAEITYTAILDKVYNRSDNTFTITFNAGHYDFSSLGETVFVDMMINGRLPISQNPVVTRRLSDDDEWEVLTEGSVESGADYSYTPLVTEEPSSDSSQFKITLFPKAYQDASGASRAYCFVIKYKVEPYDEKQDVHNTVQLEQLGIRRVVDGEWFDPASEFDSYGHIFDIRLPKHYEGGNPGPAAGEHTAGAVFGLYRADNDRLIATCVAEEDPIGSGQFKRNIYFTGDPEPYPMPFGEEFAYVPGGDEDIIAFHSDGGLGLNVIYYIAEIETPEYYELSNRRYYFYATTPNQSDSVPEVYNSLISQGINVTVLDNWQAVTVGTDTVAYTSYTYSEPLLNTFYPVNLPTTGSTGTLILYTVGTALLLLPLAVVLKNRKRKS